MSKFKMLIVVDAQNDFVTGSLGSAAAQEVVPSIVERVAVARENKEFVVFTQDTHNAETICPLLRGRNCLCRIAIIRPMAGRLFQN